MVPTQELQGQRLHDFRQCSHIRTLLLVLIVRLTLACLTSGNNFRLSCFALDSSGGDTELGEWSIKLICIIAFDLDLLCYRIRREVSSKIEITCQHVLHAILERSNHHGSLVSFIDSISKYLVVLNCSVNGSVHGGLDGCYARRTLVGRSGTRSSQGRYSRRDTTSLIEPELLSRRY